MEMIVCPHCGSLQRQTADLGAQLQCESCYKPFIVAPEEAEACIGGRHGGRAAGTHLPRRDAHRRLQPDAAGKTLQ